jgi:hypothetical protein
MDSDFHGGGIKQKATLNLLEWAGAPLSGEDETLVAMCTSLGRTTKGRIAHTVDVFRFHSGTTLLSKSASKIFLYSRFEAPSNWFDRYAVFIAEIGCERLVSSMN